MRLRIGLAIGARVSGSGCIEKGVKDYIYRSIITLPI
jgi:hypothetical protein